MEADTPPLAFVPSKLTSLLHNRMRMAHPLKDPDKQEDPLNADISVADGMQLFSEIKVNEQALVATVSNVRAGSIFSTI